MSTNNISTTARLETIYDKLVPDPAPATGSWDSGKIAISAISVVEIVYLVEKKRLSEIALEVIRKALNNPNHVFGGIVPHCRGRGCDAERSTTRGSGHA